MKKILKGLSLGAISAFAIIGLSGGNAALAQTNQTMQTNLTQLSGSGASGTASVQMVDSNQIRVRMNVTGTSPNLPHAQHLHIGGNFACPGPEFDTNNDGIITTTEGTPSYGPVEIALTTDGPVDQSQTLNVAKFPKADASGNLTYDRTFALPSGVTQDEVRKAVVIHHGISELFDDKAKYDGSFKSELDEKLPQEATVTAACGALASAPVGGVSAGFGPTEGLSSAASLTIGAATLAAAGVGAYTLKRRTES